MASMKFIYSTRYTVSNMGCEMRNVECRMARLPSVILPDGKEAKNLPVCEVKAHGQVIMYTYLWEKPSKIKGTVPVDMYVVWDHNGKVLSTTSSRQEYERAIRITMTFWSDIWQPTINNRRKTA